MLRIGAATAARIEETYEPNFNAVRFFPDWYPGVVEEHAGWLAPDHYDPASGMLKLSVQIGRASCRERVSVLV